MARTPEPVPADQPLFEEELPGFILVRTDQVDEGDRLRAVDPVWAEALGQIMLREGQRTPIEICRLPGSKRWTLVAGGHRLAGAGLAGIEFLRAEVVSADRDERRSREISENLWREDLPVTRDQLRTQLCWLEEQGLIRLSRPTDSLIVAGLRERGADVAVGRAFVDGVQRPSPGR